MSSLAAARADNYHYSAEELNKESKKKLNRIERKKKKDYIIIRFAMPRTGICTECKMQVYMGVRFDAKKYTVDSSKNAYSFDFNCKNCHAVLRVSTAPDRNEFIFEKALKETISYTNRLLEEEIDKVTKKNKQNETEGAKFLHQLDDNIDLKRVYQATNTEIGEDAEEKYSGGGGKHNQKQLVPFHKQQQKQQQEEEENERKALLGKLKTDLMEDSEYVRNKKARAILREERKHLKRQLDNGKQIGLSIPLLDHEDGRAAAIHGGGKKKFVSLIRPSKKLRSTTTTTSSSTVSGM